LDSIESRDGGRRPDPHLVEATMAKDTGLRDDAGDAIADEIDAASTGRGGGGGGFVTGLVVGALLGAGIALLFAPDAGDVTRERLGRQLRDFRKEGGARVERATRRGRRGMGRGGRAARERLRDFLADAL
jgi:hypothetical protein